MGGVAPGRERRADHARSLESRRRCPATPPSAGWPRADGSRDRRPRRPDGHRHRQHRHPVPHAQPSKGPAVWGPRAQADKYKYAKEVQRLLATCPNLDIISGEVAEIETDDTGDSPVSSEDHRGRVARATVNAVILADGTRLPCRAVDRHHRHLPPRPDAHRRAQNRRRPRRRSRGPRTLGMPRTSRPRTRPPQNRHAAAPEARARSTFAASNSSPATNSPRRSRTSTNTSPASACHSRVAAAASAGELLDRRHQASRSTSIIRANLHRAPMYSGQIASTGPRYCPSIEDKVVRFADKQQPSHLPRARRPRHRRDLLQRHQHLPARRRAGADHPPDSRAGKRARFCATATPSNTTWSGRRRFARRWKPRRFAGFSSPGRSTAPAATRKPPRRD